MWGRAWIAVAILGASLVPGCGGSQPQAEAPQPASEAPQPESKEEPAGGTTSDQPAEQAEEKPAGKAPAGEPSFKEDGSVEDAVNAVPQGAERTNVEQEVLAKPLMNEDLYKPCKLAPNQHFKLRVAVWDGKAVGIDVLPTPKNDAVVACIKQQVRGVTWKARVKSLNTVEYQY